VIPSGQRYPAAGANTGSSAFPLGDEQDILRGDALRIAEPGPDAGIAISDGDRNRHPIKEAAGTAIAGDHDRQAVRASADCRGQGTVYRHNRIDFAIRQHIGMDLVTRVSSVGKQVSGTGAHAGIFASEVIGNGK
jgi:hypothetical protein